MSLSQVTVGKEVNPTLWGCGTVWGLPQWQKLNDDCTIHRAHSSGWSQSRTSHGKSAQILEKIHTQGSGNCSADVFWDFVIWGPHLLPQPVLPHPDLNHCELGLVLEAEITMMILLLSKTLQSKVITKTCSQFIKIHYSNLSNQQEIMLVKVRLECKRKCQNKHSHSI